MSTAKGQEQTTIQSPDIKRAIPPRIFALCAIAAAVLEWFVFRSVSIFPFLPIWFLVVVGLAIGAAGLAFMGWGYLSLRAKGATVKTYLPAENMAHEGAFDHSRNPMYVGFVALLVAGAVTFDSLPFLVAAIVLFFYFDRFVIRREEQYLQRAFGVDYDAYCARVRRWL